MTLVLALAPPLALTLTSALTSALALALASTLPLALASLRPYRAPFPSSTADSAALKARVAKDGRNGPNPSKQALDYLTENRRRNQPKSLRP